MGLEAHLGGEVYHVRQDFQSHACILEKKESISGYRESPYNNSRRQEVFIEPDKCILQPANATHEPRSDRIRVQTITCSKCLSQASLQSQLPHMPGNFPRCFRREAIVLFPTMLNLRRNPQKKEKISNVLLREICFIPLDSRS